MRAIEIMRAGLLTTVQDKGRIGYQKEGMPVSGAMDAYAMQVGNILVGNARGEAVLEMTIRGCRIKFHGRHLIALCGADGAVTLNETKIGVWQTHEVEDGDVLDVGFIQRGCRLYLAISGGLDVPLVLGSRSTLLRAKLGGWEGRALQAGDFIPVANRWNSGTIQDGSRPSKLPSSIKSRRLHDDLQPQFHDHAEIRVISGPQQHKLSPKGWQIFLASVYTVAKDSDRMGYRLDGPEIELQEGADILSDAVPLGGIQVSGQGQPIVMLADRQPTGGYAKLAVVILSDIAKFAQLRPGQKVSFKEVSLQEAHSSWRKMENELSKLHKLI